MASIGTFDYTIIGGGTAGLVVASRLSEDPNVSVLVLEAGQDRLSDPRVSIPGMASAAQRDPDLAYRFKTVPQKHLDDRVIVEPQGKMLGGSSGINNQAFIAPDATGIDAWEELGNEGWNWKTLAPYYRKAFTRAAPEKDVREGLGIGYLDGEENASLDTGPLQVSYTGTLEIPLAQAWVETFEKLGYADAKADPFDGTRIGGYANPSSVDGKTKARSYAHSAYLQRAMERSNLTVRTGALVEKIVFAKNDGAGNAIAEQVNFKVGGQEEFVRIGKEVILAAGALQSPKMLELSGIGDPAILHKHGIEVVVPNENVGANLQSRLMTGISFEVKPGVETLDDLIRQDPEVMKRATDQYQQGKGPLTVGGIASYGSMPFMATEVPGQPRIEPLLAKAALDGINPKSLQIIRKIMQDPQQATGPFWMRPLQWPMNGQIQSGSYVTLGTNQCYPFSRGTVHISSADSSADPVIDPNYLSHEIDMELLSRQVFWLQTLGHCSPLAELFVPQGRRNHDSAYFRDLDDAKKYVRQTAVTEYHPCGTCAMLPKDQGGVVSTSLLVYGTQNLRVVDSSMMPMMTSSNLQPTVYAVAERVVDIIKCRG